VDKFERMAWDVLEEVKEKHPLYFEEDNWDEEARQLQDEIFIVAILNGILYGIEIGQKFIDQLQIETPEIDYDELVNRLDPDTLLRLLEERRKNLDNGCSGE